MTDNLGKIKFAPDREPPVPHKSFDAVEFLATVPNRPGTYVMYDVKGGVIYVGKAGDLKKRLSSYFNKNIQAPRTRALVAHIHHIEFTVTFSETEALILENNLIKEYQPRYNILLRDDKSYPFLLLSNHEYPGLFYHRGPKKIPGTYFGPFPDAAAVKESLRLIQRIFPIRQCSDNVLTRRTRPCLMAQLGRCLAPCASMSDEQKKEYQAQVALVRLFLKGQDQELLNDLTSRMQKLAAELKFEEAAKTRDQLLSLRKVQESQSVSTEGSLDLDVVAGCISGGIACVHVLFVRKGRVLGTRSYFPKFLGSGSEDELLSSFLTQFYLNDNRAEMLPKEILLEKSCDNLDVLADAVEKQTGRKVRIEVADNLKKERLKYLALAGSNAKTALNSRLASKATAKDRIESLESILGLKDIRRMECFDISHTRGELTSASCVVFNREGPEPSRYRRFNIEGITPGDDFGAMEQVLTRRFKDIAEGECPDIVFIDGGLGQLSRAEEVLSASFRQQGLELPAIIAVAKGEGRREGLETLIKAFSHEEIHLCIEDPAMQLVLHIRDESHRFAITGHRIRRSKARKVSSLEQIEGVGPKRRQALLSRLGGRQEVQKAGVDELAKVPGISRALAKKIYDALH